MHVWSYMVLRWAAVHVFWICTEQNQVRITSHQELHTRLFRMFPPTQFLPHYTATLNLRSTRKKKQTTPTAAIMMPGTMKDMPQAVETNAPAMSEPRMLPTEVCEFHTPMMNPRLQQQPKKKKNNKDYLP